MTIVELGSEPMQMTFRQRWSHYLALIFGGLAIVVGLNLRDSTLNATTLYSNAQAGITAEYPLNWLLDESGDYVFRVQDISARGFPTTIQVAARPIGTNTEARNIFDALTLSRAPLAGYSVLSEEPFALPDETMTRAMSYSYVATQTNPFLQNIPVVVQGIDILITARGQAIIITFQSESSSFDANLPILQRFLESLQL